MASNNNYCCVPNCNSWAKRKSAQTELRFHLFPKEKARKVYVETKFGKFAMDQRRAWAINLGVTKPITNYMRVCSLHFLDSDYCTGLQAKSRVLKKNAVPSQNLSNPNVGIKLYPSTPIWSKKCKKESPNKDNTFIKTEARSEEEQSVQHNYQTYALDHPELIKTGKT